MSTPAINYDALAAQSGGSAAPVDYDALAAQHGGTAAPDQGKPQSGGFLSTLGDIGAGAVKGLTSSATAIPAMLGNAINKAAGYQTPQRVTDQENYLQPTNTAQKIGKYGEQAAEMLGTLAPAISGAISAIPTTAKAGKLFDEVANAAKDVPVNLTRTQPALERVAQLTDAGGPVLNAPNKLLLRSQTVNPIPYQEARDFYTNISNLSASDKMALNGPMKRAVGDLTNSFKQDIGDAAASVGKGDQFNAAMQQYAQAMQLKEAAKTVGKYAAGAAVGGTVLYPALETLKNLLLK